MKSKFKLYIRILKSIFWKSKDTKWIIIMASLVITMISVLSSVSANIEKSFYQAVYQTSQYDYMISDLKYQEAKDYLKYVSQKYPSASHMIATDAFQLDIPESDFYLNVIGMEGDCQKIYQLNMVEGNYPQRRDEIVLDNRVEQFFDGKYKIGDEIELQILSQETLRREKVSYRICGFFAPENNGGYELYGFTNLQGMELAQEQAKRETSYVAIVCAEEATTESIIDMLNDLDDKLRTRVILNHTRLQMITDMEEASNSFVKVFRYIGYFIAITSFALLFNMFQMTTVHKIRQLGLMRCIGLNRKQLVTGLFFNLMLYLTYSTGIGFCFYVVLEKIFGKIFISQFLSGFAISQIVDMQWHFNALSFLQSALLIFLIMLLVYCRVIWHILKITPLEAIDYKGEVQIRTRKEKIKKKKVIAFLGRRNLRRNKWRSIYTAMTVFVMTFLICTIVTVLGSVDLFNMDALKKGNLFDYEFYGDSEDSFLNLQDLDRIAALQGVDFLCGARSVVYEFFQEKEAVMNANTLVETRVYGDELFVRICEENNIKYNESQRKPVVLLLSMDTSKIDEIILYDKQHKERVIPIYAVISKDNYSESLPVSGRVYLVMNEVAAQEFVGCLDYNVLFVAAKDKTVCLGQIESYLQTNGIKMYYNDLKVNNSDARMQLQSIIRIAIYLVFCVGLMAIVNIICNISINIQMRMHEYGIMMSMGMSRKQVICLIVYEIMIVVEKAVIFALPLSIFIAFGVVSMIGQQANVIKVFVIAIISALLVYGINYMICFAKGSYDFSKNILGLMQRE